MVVSAPRVTSALSELINLSPALLELTKTLSELSRKTLVKDALSATSAPKVAPLLLNASLASTAPTAHPLCKLVVVVSTVTRTLDTRRLSAPLTAIALAVLITLSLVITTTFALLALKPRSSAKTVTTLTHAHLFSTVAKTCAECALSEPTPSSASILTAACRAPRVTCATAVPTLISPRLKPTTMVRFAPRVITVLRALTMLSPARLAATTKTLEPSPRLSALFALLALLSLFTVRRAAPLAVSSPTLSKAPNSAHASVKTECTLP